MLLAIDVGNTNTVLGVFDAGKLRDSFRVQTEKDRTGDEYGLQIKALFDFANLRMSDAATSTACRSRRCSTSRTCA